MRQLLGTIIFIVFFPSLLPGLDPDKPVDQYLVDKWEMASGIPSNQIRSICQTPDGYLWIGTEKGLVRFDGIKFSSIRFAKGEGIDPMKGSIPEALFVDKEGILWIGSAVGLTSYRHQTRRFHTFTPADGITRDSTRRIKDDIRGNLWISFASGYVDRFFNGRFTAYNASHGLEGKKLNTIVEDPNGNLLVGSREAGAGVFMYKDGKFSKYPIPGLGNRQVIFMHWDRKEELWIGTNNGLFRVIGKGTQKYTTNHGLSDNYIICMIEDSDWNLWVGTSKGLTRIKRKQDGTIRFESMLEHFTITCLFEDRERSLWIGTYTSGIKRLKEGKFTSYAPLEAHPEEAFFSLFEDGRGDTWIGALGGKLFRCRDTDLIETLEVPGLSGNNIISIAEDAEGNLWLGTNEKGAFQKKNKTYSQFTTLQGLTDNLVTSIFRDSKDNLWFSTFDGVSVIRMNRSSNSGEIAIQSLKSRNGLMGKRVHNVYEDKTQNIWVAADRGITVLQGGRIERKYLTYYLQDICVTCIYEDVSTSEDESRVYWIATHGAGLKRLTLKDGIVTSFNTADGMSSDFIYQFFEDQQENFWLMSNSGILRVSKNELNRFANHRVDEINCTSFGTADGIKSLEFDNKYSRNSALKASSGEFRFITRKGISIVNPAAVYINKISPPVVIETVLFNRQPLPLHRETHAFKDITDFRFLFTAPTFLSPEKIKFKYQLEGYDSEYVSLPAGSERAAQYQNLAPGTYTFRVIACNSEGVWNRTGDSFTFTLKPSFHQTFLFKAIIFFMLIFLVSVGFYIYKKRPFEKKAKHKGTGPHPQFVDQCIKKLTYMMEIEKMFCNPDISLTSLAEKLSISPHLLSQILNERLNKNFSDFINSYRVEEAKRIFQSPGGAREKIELVAFDVGFNTLMAFYNAFKKYTHMTPAQYKKKVKKKK